MRLHWIVILSRDAISRLDADLRPRQRGVRISARGIRGRVVTGGCDQRRAGVVDADDRGRGLVAHGEPRGRVLRDLERGRDDDCDGLAEEVDLRVLQNVEALADLGVDVGAVRRVREAGRIAVRQDGHHAGRAVERVVLDGDDATATDATRDDHRIHLAGLVELGRILCGARDLRPAVDAGQGRTDR